MDTAADHGGCLLADRFPARLVIGDLLEIRASWILDRVDRWPVLNCCTLNLRFWRLSARLAQCDPAHPNRV